MHNAIAGFAADMWWWLGVMLNYTDPENEIYTCTAPNTFPYSQAGGLRTDVSIDGSDGENVSYFDAVGICDEFILLVELDSVDMFELWDQKTSCSIMIHATSNTFAPLDY